MSLTQFIKKQFIDILEWTEDDDGTLAWRYPMRDNEIQNGASLTVRESQQALFVDEGVAADVFGPGRHRLSTATLPLGQAVCLAVQERRLFLLDPPAT
jgi:membrane protease subunit (stomatin/prohibitin family)